MKQWWSLPLVLVAVLVLSAHVTRAATDWDEDDDSVKGAKPPTGMRNSTGAVGDQALKVQATLPSSGRLPDTSAHPEKAHHIDDDGNASDD